MPLPAMRKGNTRSGFGNVGRRSHGFGYAESHAPSSAHSRMKGGRSVCESSAWGSDDTGLESVVGAVHSQYIDALRRSKKRSKAALALPPQWLPEVYWEPMAHSHPTAALGIVRFGFGMVGVTPLSSVTEIGLQALARVYLIGGRAATQQLPSIVDIAAYDAGGRGASPSRTSMARMHTDRSVRRKADVGTRPPRQDQGLASFDVRPCSAAQREPLLAEWHQAPGCVTPRRLHNPCVCALGGGSLVVVFGGLDLDSGEVSGDLFVFDVARGTWRKDVVAKGCGPPPCVEAAIADTDGGSSALLHGGRSSVADGAPALSCLRRLNAYGDGVLEWRGLEPPVGSPTEPLAGCVLTEAPARRAHSMVTRSGGEGAACAYIFGGYNEQNEVCADVHVVDLQRGLCLMADPVGSNPVPRAYHTAVRCGPYMVVFGGIAASGQTISDLRLMHLPTLLWSSVELSGPPSAGLPPPAVAGAEVASDASSDSGSGGDVGRKLRGLRATRAVHSSEPLARSEHGAIALRVGARPGVCSMLVFGGRNAAGEALGDVFRLVLQLPREPEPSCAVKAHPDRAYEFVMTHLIEAMLESHQRQEDQLRDMRLQEKVNVEEVRNLDTHAMSVRAQVAKHEAACAAAEGREAAILREVEAEEARLAEIRNSAKARLRELEIEADSLAAKVQRLRGEQISEFQALSLQSNDLDFEASTRSGEVENELVPRGVVERREIRWRGARATVEAIRLWPATPRSPSSRSRASSPNASRPNSRALQRQSSRSPSPAPAETLGFVSEAKSRSPSRQPTRSRRQSVAGSFCPKSSSFTADAQKATMALQSRWVEAARSELHIVGTLKHPNLQEVFGACADEHGVYLVVEPFLDSLASALVRGRHRASTVSADGRCQEAGVGVLTEAQRLHISCDLAGALEYLHAKGVAHRHVVLQNVFLRESTDAGLIAKLGGHFAARTACRKACTTYVPCAAALRERGTDSFGEDTPVLKLASVDVRHVDVFAMGAVLLRLWVSQEFQPAGVGGDLQRTRSFNTEDPEAVAAERSLGQCLRSADVSCAARIRDRSVRLVVTSCMAEEAGQRPSAGVLRRAWSAIRVGDLDELPTLEEDPTRSSLLADMVADPLDD